MKPFTGSYAGVRTALLAAMLGCGLGAQAQVTADVPLSSLGAAPQNGTLAAVDADWGVAGGSASTGWVTIGAADGGPYSHYVGANQVQTWTFSKAVDLRFTVLGFNGPQEGIKLPIGTRCTVPGGATITFTAATGVVQASTNSNVAARGAVVVSCVLAGVSSLVLDGTGLGPSDYRRGLGQLTLAIPEVTGVPVASGTVGSAYGPEAVTAADSEADDGVPLTYAIASGALPPGLSLNSSTGAVEGTPTVAGVFTFEVIASNGPVQSLPRQATITIAAAPVPAAAVPMLEGGGLGLLAAAMAALGLRGQRRRQGSRRGRD